MPKMIEKPFVTVSGKRILFETDLHLRLSQDLPQEGVEWRKDSDGSPKYVYSDVTFIDFGEQKPSGCEAGQASSKPVAETKECTTDTREDLVPTKASDTQDQSKASDTTTTKDDEDLEAQQFKDQAEISQAFFNKRLLGQPILHTYWADKTDFEVDDKKTQFEDWIGKVQASTCTEWAIIVIEDGDFKAQIGTALFKSKLQSSTSQANTSSSSISSVSSASTASFLDRVKKGLSTIFQSDTNSDRWLTLVNQSRPNDTKVQDSYTQFTKRFRNLIVASFLKQVELYEEQLRVRREMKYVKNWDFMSYFLMHGELAVAFESLTLFDEASTQYDMLNNLFSEYIASLGFNRKDDVLYDNWTDFTRWHGLCLDLNCDQSVQLHRRIIEKRASLLDMRCYLFSKKCDLMLLQNQPWRVAASTLTFMHDCLREHQIRGIDKVPGALSCWMFISAIEVLQKCECYSCTSTMENYSYYTVDIWDCARRQLLVLGRLTNRMPDSNPSENDVKTIERLLAGLGDDPHKGQSYQKNDISPHARLKDALAGKEKFAKHLIDISEITLGIYKHIGKKRHALLIGKELAEFYIAQGNTTRALPFLLDMEKLLKVEKWEVLIRDIQRLISKCKTTDKQPES